MASGKSGGGIGGALNGVGDFLAGFGDPVTRLKTQEAALDLQTKQAQRDYAMNWLGGGDNAQAQQALQTGTVAPMTGAQTSNGAMVPSAAPASVQTPAPQPTGLGGFSMPGLNDPTQRRNLALGYGGNIVSTMMSRALEAPKNYTIDGGRETLLTWPQVMAQQAAGHTVAAAGEAKGPTLATGQQWGPGGTAQLIPGVAQATQTSAAAQASGTAAGELPYAGPKAAAVAAATLPYDNAKTAFGKQFEPPVTMPSPTDPSRNIVVSPSQLPGIFSGRNSFAPPAPAPTGMPPPIGFPTKAAPSTGNVPIGGGGVTPADGSGVGGIPAMLPNGQRFQSQVLGNQMAAPQQPQIGIPAGPSAAQVQQEKMGAATGAVTAHLAAVQRMKEQAQELLAHPGLAGATGAYGQFPTMPGSDAYNAEAELDSLRGNAILNVMQTARDMSPTGASGVRLLAQELPIFGNATASLDRKQSTDAVKASLQKLVKFADTATTNAKQIYKLEYGRDYQPTAEGAGNPAADSTVIQAARAAIAKGAPRDAVIQRLKQNGVDASGL